MERQLALLDLDRDWKLDEQTREAGRLGLAEARRALRGARQAACDDHPSAA